MKMFYTAGTVGDSYVILCKLYPVAKKERILCRHYTSHLVARPIVKEIFSLLPNIRVEFRLLHGLEVEVRGTFRHDTDREEAKEYGLVPEYYPTFDDADIARFELPAHYCVLQIESGTANRTARLSNTTFNEIIAHEALPLVVIGAKSFGMKGKNLMDFGGKTTIREVITIIRNADQFYGRLGFLSYVAVSQKVPSSVEVVGPHRITAHLTFAAVEEWGKFFVERL